MVKMGMLAALKDVDAEGKLAWIVGGWGWHGGKRANDEDDEKERKRTVHGSPRQVSKRLD
jgi:hypothetical protein